MNPPTRPSRQVEEGTWRKGIICYSVGDVCGREEKEEDEEEDKCETHTGTV